MRFPILLTFLAFVLRLWRLDAQSLRGDEAFDVLFALQPLGEIIYQLRVNQIYPPLYHTLDHFWLMVAGHSQLAARYLSFAAGVLIVPVVYRFARDLFDARTARLAALLAAVHPFLIWHAQDGRMYSMLALFVALAAWMAFRYWQLGVASREFFGLYVAAAFLALLTHYFAYFAIMAINIAALWVAWRARWTRGQLVRWLGANAIVGAAGALWIALAWARFSVHTADWIEPTSPADVLLRSLRAYSLGTTLNWPRFDPLLIGFIALALLGAWTMRMQQKLSAGRGLIVFLTVVPLALIYLGSLWRPMYDEKFLIFSVPFYLLLVTRGLLAMRQWRFLGAFIIIAAMSASLQNYYFDTSFAKSPPWREAAHIIRAQQQAGDLVVYNFPDPSLVYQIDGALPILLQPAQGAYEAGAVAESAAASERDLQQLSAQYERIWFVPQPAPNWDKEGIVARWLTRYAERDLSAQFVSLKLERYLTPRAFQKIWTPLDAQFADSISLLAYRLVIEAQTAHLTLYWRAANPIAKDYTVFVHLVNDAGALVAQQDNPPVAGTYPTSAWQPERIIVDRYAIIISNDLPAGSYRFAVGLYDAGGARLRVGGDDKIIFGHVVK